MVVPIVETDLPDGEELGAQGEFGEPRVGIFRAQSGFVRMDAGGRANPIVLLGVDEGGTEVIRTVAVADREQCCDSGLLRPEKHLATVLLELLAVDVSVRIDEHYFSLLPMGKSSRKLAGTGVPSTPKDAASSMPCDSRPRSFRGARFATTTILRPMSFSGS